MRVLVCGGRDFDQSKAVGRTLAGLDGVSLIISGGAPGADRLAESWANHNKVPLCVFPANWRFAGRAAGPLRNQAMIDHGKPDLVVAFPGGRGTADMVSRAKAAGVRIIEWTA